MAQRDSFLRDLAGDTTTELDRLFAKGLISWIAAVSPAIRFFAVTLGGRYGGRTWRDKRQMTPVLCLSPSKVIYGKRQIIH
jgi:hypothetical protein